MEGFDFVRSFVLHRDNHFPEMRAGFEMTIRGNGFLKQENAVDHGAQFGQSDGAIHGQEHLPAAHDNAMHIGIANNQVDQWSFARESAAETADNAHHALHGDGSQRFRKRVASADFDDVMRSNAACESQHFRVPIGRFAVVDRFIRAELADPGEFLVAAGRDDDFCTVAARKLRHRPFPGRAPFPRRQRARA